MTEMTKPDLSDAWAKLARAREHIAETEKRRVALLNPDLYRLRFEKDPKLGGLNVFLDTLHQPDKSINGVIGDAISNLRSVLDYAAVALVAPITGKPEPVGFPFADNKKGFDSKVAKALAACNSTIRDHFVGEVQAYQGGKGNSLWILNKLRNIDKHRFLIATVAVAGIQASWRIGSMVFQDCEMGVMAGQSGSFISGPIDIEFTDRPRPTFEIGLNEPPYVGNAPAVGVLHSIAGDVERLLNVIKIIV